MITFPYSAFPHFAPHLSACYFTTLLQSQVDVPYIQKGSQASWLFSNQVRIAGIDWQNAVSIDSPLYPSISQPGLLRHSPRTGGQVAEERGGQDIFKRWP